MTSRIAAKPASVTEQLSLFGASALAAQPSAARSDARHLAQAFTARGVQAPELWALSLGRPADFDPR